MYYFTYDGISSVDMGIRVKKANTLSSPTRSIESIEIVGRNGNLHIDNGCYNDRVISFECQIIANTKEELTQKATQIFNWLQTNIGYKKLILSDDSNYYYEAIFANNIEISRPMIKTGEMQIIFECKPLKKSISGDSVISITQSTTINNPTPHNSYPYMKVYGNGDITIKIGSQSILLKGVQKYIEIDSEMMDCYKGTASCNSKLFSPFPYLSQGNNLISWVGTVTKIEIKPRWNTL